MYLANAELLTSVVVYESYSTADISTLYKSLVVGTDPEFSKMGFVNTKGRLR